MQSFIRFLAIVCLLLSTSHAHARIAEARRPVQNNDEGAQDKQPSLLKKFAKAFGHFPSIRKRQSQICVNDTYYQVLENNSAAGPFCKTLIGAPTRTIETDYTPVVTGTTTITTSTVIISNRVHYTPVSTVTATVIPSAAKIKRQDPSPTTSKSLVDQIEVFIRDVYDNSSVASDNNLLDASMSSACSCLGVPATTTISTYTEATSTDYVKEWVITDSIANYTTTEPTAFTTVTVTQIVQNVSVASSSASPGSTFSSASTIALSTAFASSTSFSTQYPASTVSAPYGVATADDFSCPAANSTQGFLFENATLYTFNIYCDAIMDGPIWYSVPSSIASTETQCADACAKADNLFGNTTCTGFNFNPASNNGSMCFFVELSQSFSYLSGSVAATLQTVASGFTENSAVGPSFEGLGPTNTSSDDTSSSLASLFSTSPPIVTSPPISFAFRNGSVVSTAYSSGTTFSTSFGTTYANGSWWETYSYSWSTVYAATTSSTLYAEAATSTVFNGNSTGNSGGSYSEIANNTQIVINTSGNLVEYIITTTITNTTFLGNGTSFTYTYSYQNIEYGTSGAASLVSRGLGASTTTTTSYYSTTAITSYGPTFTSELPSNVSSSVEVFISEYSTGFSTVSVASGGALLSPSNSTAVGVTEISSAFSTEFVISGSSTPGPVVTSATVVNISSFATGSGTGLILSGGPTPLPGVNTSVVVNATSFATGSSTEFVLSGKPTIPSSTNSSLVPTSTSSSNESSTALVLSGVPTSTPNISTTITSAISSAVTALTSVNITSSVNVSETNALRSGTYSTTSTAPITGTPLGYNITSPSLAPSGSPFPFPSNETTTPALSTPLLPNTTTTESTSYTGTSAPRLGTYSTISSTGTLNVTNTGGYPTATTPTSIPSIVGNSSLPGTGTSPPTVTIPIPSSYLSPNTSSPGTGSIPSGARSGTYSTSTTGNSSNFLTSGGPLPTSNLTTFPAPTSPSSNNGTSLTSIISPSLSPYPELNSTLPSIGTTPTPLTPSLTTSPSLNSTLPGTGTAPTLLTPSLTVSPSINLTLPGTGTTPIPLTPSFTISPSVNSSLPGTGTAPIPLTLSLTVSPSVNSSLPGTGTAPIYPPPPVAYSLPGTGNSTGTAPLSHTSGNRSGTYSTSATNNGTFTGTGGAPSSTSPSPISASPTPSLNSTLASSSNALRSGTESTTSTPITSPVLGNITSPILTGTGTFPVTYHPTTPPVSAGPSPSTCGNSTARTVTMWETTTMYGCWSQCPPTYGFASAPPPLQSYGG